MALGHQIVTTAQVKEYLNITDGTQDNYISDWIDKTTTRIEAVIGGAIKKRSITEITNGSGDFWQLLNKPPISSITSIKYRITPQGVFTDVNADITNFQIDKAYPYKIYYYGGLFPAGFQNLQVVYEGGYNSSAETPDVFERVCIETIAEIFQESKKGTSRLGVSSKSLQAGSDSYYMLSDKHLQLLTPFIWRHK